MDNENNLQTIREFGEALGESREWFGKEEAETAEMLDFIRGSRDAARALTSILRRGSPDNMRLWMLKQELLALTIAGDLLLKTWGPADGQLTEAENALSGLFECGFPWPRTYSKTAE